MEPPSYGRGLLLDTYALVCALARPDDLPVNVTAALLDEAVPVFVSAASVWEIEIKVATGKLPRPSAHIARAARDQGFTELPMTSAYAETAAPPPFTTATRSTGCALRRRVSNTSPSSPRTRF